MDSSVAIAASYLELNGHFVLTEPPVQVADRHGYRTATDFIRARFGAYRAQLRGAYFRDPVLNLLGLIDALAPERAGEKELLHAP